jgi:large subunit ribosomal protein L23
MNNERLYKVVLGAHISEKATLIADESNNITFRVAKDATRPEIKEAIEKIYGVAVKNVTVLNVKGKVKRTFRGVGKKPSWKKAYVRLEEGSDLDFSSIN